MIPHWLVRFAASILSKPQRFLSFRTLGT